MPKEKSSMAEMSATGPGWHPLSVQVGDRTIPGAFQLVAHEVHVVGDGGSRRARLRPNDDPRAAAERLLVGIAIAADPDLAPSVPPTVEAALARQPPNNLIGLAIVAVTLVLGFQLAIGATWPFLTFGFVLTGWILAVMAHEFSHAAVAWLGGDHTIVAKGYLSFDPRRYGDLGTSLVIPLLALALGGIGFPGGAVWLRTDLMRGPFWRAAASLAGPAATLVVLLLLAAVLALVPAIPAPLYAAIALLAFLQATALILNLLPFPGLDGFNAIRPFLPAAWRNGIRRYEGLVMLLLLGALLWLPGFGSLLFGLAAAITTTLGVPIEALQAGWANFHFWRR
jgi:Zn-dependent protease